MAIQHTEIEYRAFNTTDALSLIEKAQHIKITDGFEKDVRDNIGKILLQIKNLVQDDYLTPFKEIHSQLKSLQIKLNISTNIDEIGLLKHKELLDAISTLYRVCFEQVLRSREHNDITEISKCFLAMVECERGEINQAPLFNPANESLRAEWKRRLDKITEPLMRQIESASDHLPFLNAIIQVKEFLEVAGDNDYVNKYFNVKKNQFILPYLKEAVENWIKALRKSPANKCEDFLRASNEIVNVLETRKLISTRTNAGISENIDYLIWRVKFAKAELLAHYSSKIPKKALPKSTPKLFQQGVSKIGQVLNDPNSELKKTIELWMNQLATESITLNSMEKQYSELIKNICERGSVQEIKKECFPEQMPKDVKAPIVTEPSNNNL